MIRAINTNLSYFRIRKIIGILGVSLPAFAPLIAQEYLSTISYYYYTISGVLFTSVLILCGVFLISYRGYEHDDEKISDNIITRIGGLLIIVVAVVPTTFSELIPCDCGPTPICHCDDSWGWIHFGSAALFFVCMGYLSIFNFTRGPNGKVKSYSKEKIARNWIYRTCGIAIWAILAFGGFMFLFFEDRTDGHFVFWVEVALLILFGISWLVKGKALADLGIQKDNPKLSESEAKEIASNLVETLTSFENGKALVTEIELPGKKEEGDDS